MTIDTPALEKRIRRAVAGGCLVCAASAVAGPLTLHTLDWAPYSWRDKSSGATIGIAVDIVHELMARADITVASTDIIPWARGLTLTSGTADTCQMMVGRTAERERKFQWIGPIGQTNWALFAPREDKIVLQSLNDAQPYLVGTIIDDLSIPLLKSKNIRVAEVASDRLNPPKLLRRRIDLWATAELPALYILRDLGIKDLEPVFRMATVHMYLACNRNMPDGEVARLNGVVKAMISDKSIDRIYAGYGFKFEVPAAGPP
ncbi:MULTISPECIES: ABC transporter substrate-binding protein [unclassified Duganella]|uniref:substrate-binding periplasmic protein n=1 Tax=unclassified Duganella TaxID=2636909 RepID=UPI001314878A|nr:MULTISPECIES: transporter substrate-binding domain-containing protein [unclassified Duganella]